MTQLLRWLGFVCVFLAVWIALVTKSVALDIPEQWMSVLHYVSPRGERELKLLSRVVCSSLRLYLMSI